VTSPPDAQQRRPSPPLDDFGENANFGGNDARPRGRGGRARCRVRAAEAVADKLMKEAMDNVRLKVVGARRGSGVDEGKAEEERRRKLGLETAVSKNSKFDIHWARSEVIGPKP
jgi:dihydropteroate synthase